MSFAYPQILYTLPLLLIPVIIHLVQWKKYKKQAFTNVAFLKELEIKSRKSKKLKELLILASRILALFFLILAFAQPSFFHSTQNRNLEPEKTIIYLDNSLSMGIPKDNSTLFFHNKMELIKVLEDEQNYYFFSNSDVFSGIKGKKLKDFIYNKLGLSPKPTHHNQNLRKAVLLSAKDTTATDILYFSDHQKLAGEVPDSSLFPSHNYYYISQSRLPNLKNISIDSLIFIGKKDKNLHYKLWISSNKPGIETSVLIKSGNQILWSKKIEVKDSIKTAINLSLPEMKQMKAEVQIEDRGFPFDNHLYFTYKKPEQIPILIIGNEIPDFLKKIYTKDAYRVDLKKSNQIDYSQLNEYPLVILYKTQLDKISTQHFSSFLNKYGNLAIIPALSEDFSPDLFRQKLKEIGVALYRTPSLDTSKVVLNKIHFSSPFFKEVFLKPVKNFGYPQLSQHLKISKNSGWLYLLSDGTPLVQKYTGKGNVFLFSSDLSDTAFTNDPYLVVPLFYQMSIWEQKHTKPYFIIGEKNTWTQKLENTSPDEVLSLKKGKEEFIPFQIRNKKRIRLSIKENPQKAGIYALVNNKDTLDYIAFNYNRIENSTQTYQWPEKSNIHSVDQYVKQKMERSSLKKKPDLWKYLLLVALMFLIIEMLIIKYWK